jgi:hypothetical protein
MAPIPAMTKLRNIVIVCPMFSLLKKKDVK